MDSYVTEMVYPPTNNQVLTQQHTFDALSNTLPSHLLPLFIHHHSFAQSTNVKYVHEVLCLYLYSLKNQTSRLSKNLRQQREVDSVHVADHQS